MATKDPAAAQDSTERVARLWTPERVPLVVPLAGLGERALAYLADLSVLVVLLIGALFIYNLWGDIEADLGALGTLGTLLLLLGAFATGALYDVLWETLGGGRTPGKRLLGLRVLTAQGNTPDLLSSLLRNALRVIDFLPGGYAVGAVALFFTGTRRLGDLVADTFVVNEHNAARDPLALCRAAADDTQGERRPWSDADVLRALSVVERTARVDAATARTLSARALLAIDAKLAQQLDPERARAELAAQVLRHASQSTGMAAELARLAAAERELRGALGALKDGCELAVVDRADAAIRRGASELMRAERRQVPAHRREALSLALLDAERRRVVRGNARRALSRFWGREVPAAVWEERGLVARAGAVLATGLLLGGALAWADPALAQALVGDELAAQIEKGAAWTDRIEADGTFAQASAQIIINNIMVGVRVFGLGLLGGVATLLGLLSNGVQIGAVFGYALRLDTAATLLRFILAHGPVELSSICVAGAGGMCLGRALISPGRRTRIAALREEGARGARLLCAAVLGFLCIGAVEGFVSPGKAFPAWLNGALGLSLLALYWGWVRAFGGRSTNAR
ncbi:MAG: stage II sporulation protein M [Deltaproteobacteria bacterium]|nr:stage II sporulation protein M [Deltaproteobacteria bacterium]